MSKKEILCEECDAVFRIQHNMEEHYYSVKHCPFCSNELNSENEDEIEDFDEDEW
tara:strand:- start:356 stop:520 length:165 start_codon:yes stop_codon:yes gene_type:complete